MFGYAVVVQGPLKSWGEFAALGSETGRSLMVDLRSLSPEAHAAVDRALVEKAKRRQVSVWCWTADSAADWARVVEAGVDGIITNVPHRLRDWLKS